MMSWREALAFLAERGLSPGTADKVRHTELRQRNCGKSYQELLADLGGRKNIMYEESRQKRDAAEKEGKNQPYLTKLRG